MTYLFAIRPFFIFCSISPTCLNFSLFSTFVCTDLIVCESSDKFQGLIFLKEATIQDDPDKKGFQIIKKGRKFHFWADSEEEKHSWMNCLKTQTLIRDSLLKEEVTEMETKTLAHFAKDGILSKQLLTCEWQSCYFLLKESQTTTTTTTATATLYYYKIHANRGHRQSLLPKAIKLEEFYLTKGPNGMAPSWQIHLVRLFPREHSKSRK